MKAVVVELNKNRAAVLSDDGCIVTVRNDNYEIGQVIQMKSQKLDITKKLSVFAASAAAFVILGVGTWAYASPYTYVSVDVNPSIEFIVNRFDRVIKVKAVNDDGEEILKEIPLNELTNESIENAVINTVDQLSEAGYFDGETEGGIVIATSSEDTDKADELADELQTSVEEVNQENGDSVVVETLSVGLERVKEAQELGVTPGKLNLVEKLQEAAGDSTEVNIDEWLDKPVKDIMKATKDYKKSAKEAAKENSEDAAGEGDNDITITSENQEQADSQSNDKEDKQLQKDEDKASKQSEKEQANIEKDTQKDQKQSAKGEDKPNTSQDKNSGKKDKDSAATTNQGTSALTDNSSGKKTERDQGTDQSTDKNSSKSTEKKAQPTKDEDKKAQQSDITDVPSGNNSDTTEGTPGTGTDGGNHDVADNSHDYNNQSDNSSQGSAGSDNSSQGSDKSTHASDNSSHASDNPGKTDNEASDHGRVDN